MRFYLISLALTVAIVVHIVKTGRDRFWIYIVVFLPMAGPIAYLVVEVLPGLWRSRGTQRAMRSVRKTLDPERDLRRLESERRFSNNIDAHRRYAEELIANGRAGEAIQVYRDSLKGIFEHDATLMLGLAQAQFTDGRFAEARQTLDQLRFHNPDFKSADGHLLYARALEGEGNLDKAQSEFRALAEYYPGAEAAVRYAQLLKRRGDEAKAKEVLAALLEQSQRAPRHYRRMQREWLDMARRELAA
ncbi:MAG: tetratricopeptide repeat protein [Steroidobacterales bacterium]